MPQEIATLTSEGLSSPEPAVSSPAESTHTTPEPGATTSEETIKTEGDTGTEPASTVKTEGDGTADERFDKHPRWQAMLKERNEAREKLIALEARQKAMEDFQAQARAQQTQQTQPQKTEDFDAQLNALSTQLDAGDIDIGEFSKKQTQILDSKYQALMSQQVQQLFQARTVQDVQSQFLKDNPRFAELQRSGKLEEIKKSDPYGFHDDYSAYHAYLTNEVKEQAEKEKAESIAKAVKETEARILADLKAKGHAQTLGQASSAAPTDETQLSPELKNPKKFGGTTTVLAQRLAAFRKKAS